MEIICQDAAKDKIISWRQQGLTDEVISQKLSFDHGFFDLVIKDLLKSTPRPKNIPPPSPSPPPPKFVSPSPPVVAAAPSSPSFWKINLQKIKKYLIPALKEIKINLYNYQELKLLEWLALFPSLIMLATGHLLFAALALLVWNHFLPALRDYDYTDRQKLTYTAALVTAYLFFAFLINRFTIFMLK